MDAEQAWEYALGQLQMEMPKTSFDTWVRDTHLVSYEDGKFVVGVRTDYARDWLDSRLSSTAEDFTDQTEQLGKSGYLSAIRRR